MTGPRFRIGVAVGVFLETDLNGSPLFLAAVLKYLGHTTMRTVVRYAHLSPQVHKQAIAGMMSYYDAS